MWLRSTCAAVVVGLFALTATAGAQQDDVAPEGDVPAAPPAPAPQAAAPAALAAPAPPASQNVLGRSRAPAVPTPPVREAPRAHVSIVSPQQSRVHKGARGTRTQDGDGIDSGAAGDQTTGPSVERLE